MSKQFLAVIAIIILGLFGVFALTKNKDKANQPASSNTSQAQGSNHKTGAGKKKVTLIEYGDFQCPACKSFYPVVKQIKESYGDDITLQFRHYPLTQIHQNAMAGARAAEAAGNQGKFFEMHDLLYENQTSWSAGTNPVPTLEAYATQLGLDINKFKADMASESTNSIINADIKLGQSDGANSTPTFVINGKKVDPNPTSVEAFKKLIDDAIAQQTRS